MTPQEIKERRRQRILARSQQFQKKNQQPEQQPLINKQEKPQNSTTQNISSYERFKLSKKYEHSKNRLNYYSILAGFIVAILQYLFEQAVILFYIFMLGIILNIFIIQRMFSSLEKIANSEEVVKQLQKIKQIQLINQLLKWREVVKPVLKYMSGYLITIVGLGFLQPSQI